MTAKRNVEHVLQRWLVDGVDEMPDRVYLSILDRVERQPQRRAWRVPWRDSHVNTYLKPIVAIAAVLVVAVAGFAMLSQPSSPSVGGTAAASPSPSPSPSASPSQSASPSTGGTFASRNLQPRVTYTITSPWVQSSDWPIFFQIYPDTPGNRDLALSSATYPPYILVVPRPTISPTACAEETTPDGMEVNSAEFVEYVASREGISATEPVPVTVSGLTGLQIDIAFGPAGSGCFLDMPSDAFSGPPAGIRYIVLDNPDGGSLMISLVAPTDFDEFLAEAMPVVETFEFDPGPVPSRS